MLKIVLKLTILLAFLGQASLHSAERKESKALPMALEAIKIVLNPQFESKRPNLFVKGNPLGQMVNILKKQKINKTYLEKILNAWDPVNKGLNQRDFLLREDNETDKYLKVQENRKLGPIGFYEKSLSDKLEMPRMALHAYEFEVIDEKDEFLKDDIYFFFYTTDGALTTGKVTEVYKGLSQGNTFFLTAQDRVIFPAAGIGYATPYKHLIVDYSIIESDGDDIKEMQKLSQSIIPLAAAAYGLYTGDMGSVMTAGSSVALRKEVGKLSNSLISLNNDDRLVNESLMYTPKKLQNVFLDEDLIEFSKFYKGQEGYHSWHYKLNFRMFND